MNALVSSRAESRVDPSVRLGLLLAGGSLLGGLLAGELVSSGHASAVFGLSAVILPVFLWKRPEFGPTVLLAGGLLVEQFGYTVGARSGAATAQIPLFHGTGGLHISPADILLALLFGIYAAKSGMGSVRTWPRSATNTAMCCLFAAVVYGLVIGKIHGGTLRFAFTEVRPFVYLVATFVLASVLVTTRTALRAALWAIVIAVGIKAGQGLLLFMSVRHLSVRPDAVLGHEEALFFSLFFLLTLALWLFELRGPLRTTATCLAPVVLAGDLANTRRAAWLVLGVGLLTLLTVSYAVLPRRRRVAGRILLGLVLVCSVYLPVYWNKSGGLAQPARAIHSAVSPTTRDASSDLYRIQEDENLWFNIRQSKVIGKGFGSADRLRAADRGHQRHRSADHLHPAQRRSVHPDADGDPGRDRVLVDARSFDRLRLSPGAGCGSGARGRRCVGGGRPRLVRIRGPHRPGLLLLPGCVRRRDPARAG